MRTDVFRLLMSLSIMGQNIIAEQIDVVTAFLNAHLTEDLYMNTLEGSDSRSKLLGKFRSRITSFKQALKITLWVKTSTL